MAKAALTAVERIRRLSRHEANDWGSDGLLLSYVPVMADVLEKVGTAFAVTREHDEGDDETQDAWREAWLAYKAFEALVGS